MAALFAIKSFAKRRQQISVLLLTDNISVVAHVNKMGGTKSPQLISQVKELWAWCLQRHITVTAQHLPGLDNVTADFLFRHFVDRNNWMLDPSVFQCLDKIWGPLEVDMFATRFSTQVHSFFGCRPDPEAEATNALVQSWSNIMGYAYPPRCLISRVLLKVRSDKATIVLITPL